MSENPLPIIVIDTQLVLRATLNERSLPAKIFFNYGHLYILAVSPGIRAEVADVLTRPSIRAKFTSITDESVARVLSILDAGQQISPEDVPPVSRDPKDDIFLATAVMSGAQYIVTEDKDLLVLNPYEGIRILNALEFLNIIQPSLKTE
ncbi:MAG: putative toxin-antitoxin system toxin component, PIN family [Anaerolineaceae bacterium]|nr:putative toxin-antitoxin system toxin component, PIN family [Anaerolineaceae bacterium]